MILGFRRIFRTQKGILVVCMPVSHDQYLHIRWQIACLIFREGVLLESRFAKSHTKSILKQQLGDFVISNAQLYTGLSGAHVMLCSKF